MKTTDRIRAKFGANMAESMARPSPRNQTAPDNPPAPAPGPGRHDGVQRLTEGMRIALDRITPDPDQPRKEFDPESLAELAASLKDRGQLQPVRVRWDEGRGAWVIVSGERRFRAAALAGLTHLAAVEAKGEAVPAQTLIDQLTENCVREDLKPVEQAVAYESLMNLMGWNQRQLAEHLHVHPGTVTRALGLLRLPEDVRDDVDNGVIPAGEAYRISKTRDPGERAEKVEKARAGVVKAAATRTRATFRVQGGAVTVVLDDPGAGHAAVAAALREAARKASGSRDAA